MYVCGPTVYGPPHLGHGRFSAGVRRAAPLPRRGAGYEVTYVSNITDIDDKIIERSRNEDRPAGRDRPAVREGVVEGDGRHRRRAPHPRSPRHRLRRADGGASSASWWTPGVAYETSDGVYFVAESVADYGLLARQSIDSLQAGARVEVDDDKRSPIDFALWEVEGQVGEPTSRRGRRRGAPGGRDGTPSAWSCRSTCWATASTCTVAVRTWPSPITRTSGPRPWPSGHTFARHWMHNGFVEVGGEKMSKSLGNFDNLLDLIQKSDPRAFRLLVLRSHYRSPGRGHQRHRRRRLGRPAPARHVRAPGRRAGPRVSPRPTSSTSSAASWTTT